jgi:hypothetical protein
LLLDLLVIDWCAMLINGWYNMYIPV